MLELDQDLPDSVLLHTNRNAYAAQLKDAGAIWFRGSWDAFGIDDATSAITDWQSTFGTHTATPAEPNEGNGLLGTEGDYSGLRCIDKVNCGFVVPQITQSAGTFSMAVIYKPSEEEAAKTLLTVNTAYAGGENDANYLFLSDGGDFFTVKDVRGSVEIYSTGDIFTGWSADGDCNACWGPVGCG